MLRLKERGDAGKYGGKFGDVYVSFVIKPRPDIQRRGRDFVSKACLLCDAKQTMLTLQLDQLLECSHGHFDPDL